jgi:tRNA (guanosine-2'-O-)-methyltransferase
MDAETQLRVIDFLNEFVTENKRNKFEQVLEQRTRHLTVVLEDIYQPHNASAVIRTADCFGIQDIHVVENNNRFTLNPNVSVGASKWTTLHRYNRREEDNLQHCVDALKQNGYSIIATTPHRDDVELQDLPIDKPLALAFGTEETGLTPEFLEKADGFVKIPMVGFTESFNISVSVSLVLYELSNRLRASNMNWTLSEEEKRELRLTWLRKVLARHKGLEQRFLVEQGLVA